MRVLIQSFMGTEISILEKVNIKRKIIIVLRIIKNINQSLNIAQKFKSIFISESIRLFRIIFKGPLSVVSVGRCRFIHLSKPKPEVTIQVKTKETLLERKVSSHSSKTHKMVFVNKQSHITRRHSCPATASIKPDNVLKIISDPLTLISVANLEMQPRLNSFKTRSISF